MRQSLLARVSMKYRIAAKLTNGTSTRRRHSSRLSSSCTGLRPQSLHGTPPASATGCGRTSNKSKHIARTPPSTRNCSRCGPGGDSVAALHEDFDCDGREGWIRECHGDLHLANMALIDERVVIFDALEFSDDLRWIDPLCEVAFVYMDLEHRGHSSWRDGCSTLPRSRQRLIRAWGCFSITLPTGPWYAPRLPPSRRINMPRNLHVPRRP